MSTVDWPMDPAVRGDLLAPASEQRLERLARAVDPSTEKVARDFESVFLKKIFDEMQRTIPQSGLLSSGFTEQVQGLFWFYLAQDLASKGGLGLWKDLYRQMSALGQEPPQTPTAEPKP